MILNSIISSKCLLPCKVTSTSSRGNTNVFQGLLLENSSNMLKRQETEIEGSIFGRRSWVYKEKLSCVAPGQKMVRLKAQLARSARERERDSASLRRERKRVPIKEIQRDY